MPMIKAPPAASPDGYVKSLAGWQRKLVESLRSGVTSSAKLEEAVKWGHLVYFSNGPVLLIRAEEGRVLFGFWRGKRLRDIEPALRPGGKYEMANVELREGMGVPADRVARLTRAAVALNAKEGDPRLAAKRER